MTITILFTNSTNGMLRACPTCPNLLYGGLVRRATLIKEYRQKYKDILLLDSGDLFPVIAPQAQVECALEAVDLMKYDAIGIGDQEFTYGKNFLLQKMSEVNFPFISSAIAYTQAEESGSYKTKLFARPYIIREIAGLKVLIVGVISERAFIFFPKDKIEGLTILEPLNTLRGLVSELKPKVDLIIVLSHLGDEGDERLAREVEGIDLIIGGHTQTMIEKPIKIGNTAIVQAGKNGEHLGEITLKINTKGDSPIFLSEKSGQSPTVENYKLTLLTDKIPDDPEIKTLVEEFYKSEESKRLALHQSSVQGLARTKPDTISISANKTVPSIFILTPEWNLGTVEKGRIIEGEIQLQNIGGDTLTIKKVRSSCDCLAVSSKKYVIPPRSKSSIDLKFFSEETGEGTFTYDIYIESNDPDQPVSVVLAKGRVAVAKGELRGDSPIFAVQKLGQSPVAGRIPVLFFYSPGCHSCEEIKNNFLPYIKNKYPESVVIKEYDISKKENYELLVQLEEKYGVKQSAPMEVFIGNQHLLGRKEIKERLEAIILNQVKSDSSILQRDSHYSTTSSVKSDSPYKIVQRFKSFGVFAVIVAGLLDGFNPCAFATIIFFISFLTYTGKSRKDILLTGIFFALGVFIAYFILGVGLFKIIQSLLVFQTISVIIFYAILVLTLSLGCMSLYDAYVYRKTGKTEGITLQLPRSIKENIHYWIKKNVSTSFLVAGAFTTGLLISILEAVCTGQIYIPTIMFMTKEPSLAMKAYVYLVLYNLMFILPLIVVFLLAYFGVGSQKIGKFSQENLLLTKILTAIFFFGLAIILIVLR